ncbi:hypothetical protein PYCCODRAFT_1440272, partial [Trametes coccinea BRFM310]
MADSHGGVFGRGESCTRGVSMRGIDEDARTPRGGRRGLPRFALEQPRLDGEEARSGIGVSKSPRWIRGLC